MGSAASRKKEVDIIYGEESNASEEDREKRKRNLRRAEKERGGIYVS